MATRKIAGIVALCLCTVSLWGDYAAGGEPEQKYIAAASADYVGIAKAIEYYFEAGRKGDSAYMKEVFLPEANIYFTREGKVAGGPIQILYDMVEGRPSPTEIIYTIAAVDVAGNIAMVRLEIADWAGNTYTDMFTMIRDGDAWKIASKVSRRP